MVSVDMAPLVAKRAAAAREGEAAVARVVADAAAEAATTADVARFAAAPVELEAPLGESAAG